ncbi:hypothetical protein [Nocardia sp. NPDC005998]|uniref:hypothetical protein n=1 Tax=Nocardia sp. NPDC005998 TaxID=3156894 RepID=UPI0033BBC75B
MAEYQATQRAEGDTTGLHHELTELVRDRVGQALASGTAPNSVAAEPIVDELTAAYAATFDRPDDAELRGWLLARLEVAGERYRTAFDAIQRAALDMLDSKHLLRQAAKEGGQFDRAVTRR